MINSVKKSMQILSVIANGHTRPVSVASISAATDIPKSTCVHILKTLAEDGYVEQVSHTKGYILGASTYYLTRFGKYEQTFIDLCQPVMQWLSRKTNQSVMLAVIRNNKKYIINCVDFKHVIKETGDIVVDDIYRTATGRAILANMRPADVEKIYSVYGPPKADHWHGIDSLEALQQALNIVRRQETVITHDISPSFHTIGYARPIFDKSVCISSLGVAARYPLEKYDEYHKDEASIISSLSRASKEIQRRLKYS